MKAKTILVFFVAACVAIAGLVWLGPVYRDNRRTRESLHRLQSNLDRQNQEIDRLNRELTKLRTDCRAIERVAREKFGLCREGEQIYHFETPGPDAHPQKETETDADDDAAAEP